MEKITVEVVKTVYWKTLETAEKAAKSKIGLKLKQTFILAILAGFYISLAGLFSVVVSANSGAIPFGINKLITGVSFSLGLILVVIGGAELFTGSTILTLGLNNKTVGWWQMIKNWTVVYFGNLLGSLIIAGLIFLGKEYHLGNGAIGIGFLQLAEHKVSLNFLEAFSLGIVCNMLVCLAIWLSMTSKSISGKILAIIFPITAFVAAGFEHSIANMFLIPMALLIKSFDQQILTGLAFSVENLTLINFLLNNLIPVTLGNVLGGVLIWQAYRFTAPDSVVDEESNSTKENA